MAKQDSLYGSFIIVILFFANLQVFCSVAQNRPTRDEELCIDSICFPRHKKVADQVLPLRGIAKKRFLFFDIYWIALYAPKDSSAEEILGKDSKILSIYYLRDLSGEDLIENIESLIRENPKNDLIELQDRMNKAHIFLSTGVIKGDQLEVIYSSTGQSTLFNNGIDHHFVEGKDFAQAFFGIWLSDYPVSDKVKKELIEQK